MKSRRRAGQVLGSILLALCLCLSVLSVMPHGSVEAPKWFENSHRVLSLEPITFLDGSVDINTADLAELDTLPGIGPVTGKAIIDARESGGAFYYPEDLLAVYGIGDKTLEKLRRFVTITEVKP